MKKAKTLEASNSEAFYFSFKVTVGKWIVDEVCLFFMCSTAAVAPSSCVLRKVCAVDRREGPCSLRATSATCPWGHWPPQSSPSRSGGSFLRGDEPWPAIGGTATGVLTSPVVKRRQDSS